MLDKKTFFLSEGMLLKKNNQHQGGVMCLTLWFMVIFNVVECSEKNLFLL